MEDNLVKKKIKEGIELFKKCDFYQAIESFAMVLGHKENDSARRYLARCYFRIGNYQAAYKHFDILSNSEEFKDYAISMIATIKAIQGNYGEAIKILKKLPQTTHNLINLSIMYWQKYKVEKTEWFLLEAKRILNSIDLPTTPKTFHWSIHTNLGIITQTLKEYSAAESHYKKALKSTDNPIHQGKALNEYGNLYIDMDKLDEAKEILDQASELVKKNSVAEGYNAKYRGLIYRKQKNYEEAIKWLKLASTNFEEQNLYLELAEVCIMLVTLHYPDTEFYDLATIFADVLHFEKKLKEVCNLDEKAVDFIVNNFNDGRVIHNDN